MLFDKIANSPVGDEPIHKPTDKSGFVNLASNELIHPDLAALYSEALVEVSGSHINRYAFHQPFIAALSNYLQTSADKLILTAGADDALKNVISAVLKYAGCVIVQDPGYGTNYVRLQLASFETIQFNGNRFLIEDLLGQIGTHDGPAVIISNPNSPTGASWSTVELREIATRCQRFGGVMIIDQTYSEFSTEPVYDFTHEFPCVIAIGSFSKAWGMAGARLGYIHATEKLASYLRRWNTQNPVSNVTLQLATHLLRHAHLFRRIRAEIMVNRTNFIASLQSRHPQVVPLPTAANFVNLRFPSSTLKQLALKQAASDGLLLRDTSTHRGLACCLRTTIADAAVMSSLLGSMGAILNSPATHELT